MIFCLKIASKRLPISMIQYFALIGAFCTQKLLQVCMMIQKQVQMIQSDGHLCSDLISDHLCFVPWVVAYRRFNWNKEHVKVHVYLSTLRSRGSFWSSLSRWSCSASLSLHTFRSTPTLKPQQQQHKLWNLLQTISTGCNISDGGFIGFIVYLRASIPVKSLSATI